MKELEQAVLEIIKECYLEEYIGSIAISKLANDKGYHLSLGLNNDERPMSINKEGTPEEFLKFIREEILARDLVSITYSKGYQLTTND